MQVLKVYKGGDELATERFLKISYNILSDEKLTASEKLVYAFVCSFNICYASVRTMASALGISERQVVRCIKKLVELKYIREVKTDQRTKAYKRNE